MKLFDPLKHQQSLRVPGESLLNRHLLREVLQKLLGVLAADPSFSAGVVVTSSTFSSEARSFAHKNGRLQLIDGGMFQQMLLKYAVSLSEDGSAQ